MLELAPAGEEGLYRLAVAGDTFNMAVAAAQLGCGVSYLSAIGEDAGSARIREACERWTVGTGSLHTLPGATPGLYLIRNDADGERHFAYWRDDSAAARLFRDADRLARALETVRSHWIVYSGITLAIASAAARERLWCCLSRFRREGGRVAFDCNHRAALWPDTETAANCYRRSFTECDLLLPGEADLRAVSSTPPEALLSGLGASGLLKRGGGRVDVFSDGEWYSLALPVVEAVDTTGAGDAFDGAAIAALSRGIMLEDSARFAHEVAARVVRHRGALLPEEDWPDLRSRLASL
jgi:2-dehydro-3-deoxygluconokinase